MYLLSVCIPVYNAEAYLQDCLEPLLKMGDEVQIILSDDGSKDRSVEICRSYADRYDNIDFVEGPNGGPSAARNRGLKKVQGEYIVFCDADDWLEPDAFFELKEVLEKKKYDFFHFGITVIEKERSYKQKLLYKQSKELTDPEYYDLFALVCGYRDARDLSFPSFGLVTCKIYKSSILEGLAFDPTVVGEDTLYAIEAMQRVKSAYYMAGTYYHYRIVQGSYSHKPFPKIVPMAAKMLRLMYKDLDIKHTRDTVIRKAYYNHALGKFIWCIDATGLRVIPDQKERKERLKELCMVPEFRDMIRKKDLAGISWKGKLIISMLKLGMYDFTSKHLVLR